MAVLWSAVQWLSWLALRLVALSLQLAPAAASLTTVTAVVLVSAMTTQALEHGVLTSMHRSKWHKSSSYDDLRRDFYRGYWLLTLLYVVGSVFWMYFTERTGARVVYGAVFCALWWGVQLALIVALTPLDEVLNRIKAAIKW
ncbi:hypothetical protein PF005_g23084 [Phytophthora fragariae]|uniref:ABC-2 type transporter domain-containing protein n=2 Tax=Phytophthora TaxID=4783 RepID=A0A6A3WBR6_9STRA|nr:hypothetical protein PF003_g22568 [Phytophthora fragariae]KAE9004987.1 hypothetical protein PR002_g16896 [Phytophthora rubi]KAE8925993.1 hypothetical protein PF009_g23806 [Phytophthora fragariae]KAE8982906.1 hypothetical protein PF011_g21414 [Phytophthora fragariae]KAE9008635.1 hypothetical protein PR001_g16646 [Phytophthora rubi]